MRFSGAEKKNPRKNEKGVEVISAVKRVISMCNAEIGYTSVQRWERSANIDNKIRKAAYRINCMLAIRSTTENLSQFSILMTLTLDVKLKGCVSYHL